ncbi:hypothetical protein Pmar_PMAR007067 [Perkinsus marinus ATCC 50983]|uniref:Uncharacterized protein n=1 Tax=Perkinsus marinus (strain ATCC 50983 / TXsc) TaxID=423536 RepID=C5KZP2_PERM5|nr:hypothetical protein Pmar_PMAR007067 [Perkinsus marinus ATCC 50983]EER10070.1 hypothetical protein Pmar_PMAR007067 [Perkinsus marinus ATCC 50983]|eukprot:XP_002778275.1 hypothetical protein Pmar_PMAR007067 [Perkinsus marinus ATCC 50983]
MEYYATSRKTAEALAIALSGKYPKSCISFIVLDSPRISLEAEVASIGPFPPQKMFVIQVENATELRSFLTNYRVRGTRQPPSRRHVKGHSWKN